MNALLNFIGFVLLILSIFIFGLKGMPTEMGIAVVASSIFLAFANLEKFSEFKGAGFHAKLKKAVDEANATINNLKEVAIPLVKTNLSILSNLGRLPKEVFDKNHELFNQLADLQTEIGLEGEDLVKFNNNYLNIHAWDMVTELSGNIEQSDNKGFSMKSREVMGDPSFDITPDFNKFKELVSEIDLDDRSKKQYEILEKYYSKYKL